MTILRILCPQCGRELTLKDPALLGRRGKCRACGHSFVLTEPPSQSDPPARFAPPEAQPRAQPPVPAQVPRPTDLFAALDEAETSSQASRLIQLRRRAARRRMVAIGLGTATAALVVSAYAIWGPGFSGAAKSPHARSGSPETLINDALAGATDAPAVSRADLVAAARPTHGEPIRLLLMPDGVNFVVHLRPADLWSDEPAFRELRATLTRNVTDWIARQLQATCRRDPSQIEEATFGFILGARGTPPQFAVVVRLKDEARLSDLIEEFRGAPLGADAGLRLSRVGDQAVFIPDARTIAFCPAEMGEELPGWVQRPNQNASDGVLSLLERTDRERLFTVMLEVDDVRRHANELFAPSVLPLVRQVLDRFGEDTQALAWSVHLNDQLHSELNLRTRITGAAEIKSPAKLSTALVDRLAGIPPELMATIRSLHPARAGTRTLVGRLPAMFEAWRLATIPTTHTRTVCLTTVLPAKAAPNLALAGVLTWDEMRRTGLSRESSPSAVASASNPETPRSVADRLQQSVDAEFNRTPLQEAFQFICGSVGVELEIDGDALKDAGYTQNMPQTFKLGIVPATTAIHEIIDKYNGDGKDDQRMAVCLDEASGRLIVLTKKFAAQRGLEPYLMAPAKPPP